MVIYNGTDLNLGPNHCFHGDVRPTLRKQEGPPRFLFDERAQDQRTSSQEILPGRLRPYPQVSFPRIFFEFSDDHRGIFAENSIRHSPNSIIIINPLITNQNTDQAEWTQFMNSPQYTNVWYVTRVFTDFSPHPPPSTTKNSRSKNRTGCLCTGTTSGDSKERATAGS